MARGEEFPNWRDVVKALNTIANMADLRLQIDTLDAQLVGLLAQRVAMIDRAAELKPSEGLPARIEALEGEVAALTGRMNEADFYQQDAAAMTAHTARLAAVQADLDAAYARWSELDA